MESRRKLPPEALVPLPAAGRIAKTTGDDDNSSYVRMGALSSEHTTQWSVNFTHARGKVLVGVAAEDADLEPEFEDLARDGDERYVGTHLYGVYLNSTALHITFTIGTVKLR